MVLLKTLPQIDGIRKSCRIVAYVLSKLKNEIRPGITTEYLNNMAEDLCGERGGTPGFKNYKGFPFSICASVNSEVVHGFPSDEKLKEGDILSIDFGVLYKGWYGDSAFTVGIGKISTEAEKLIKAGEECLCIGIDAAKVDGRLGDISYGVQQHAEDNGYNVVRDFVGHGIGKNLHEEPQVPNFGKARTGLRLKPGLVIAIEPMITYGSPEVKTLRNGWTAITKDNCLSTHVEHTIVIDNNGVEILTKRN